MLSLSPDCNHKQPTADDTHMVCSAFKPWYIDDTNLLERIRTRSQLTLTKIWFPLIQLRILTQVNYSQKLREKPLIPW